MARTFNPNNAGIAALLNGPDVRRVLAEIAEKGKTFAESISPYDASHEDHHYRDSFEVRDVTIPWTGQYPGPRAAARLHNTSPHAAAVEYGYGGSSTGPNESSAHRVLGRTLEYLAGEGSA